MGAIGEAVRAQMSAAGQIAAFDAMCTEREEVTARIDALRAAPFTDDREYARQMSEIGALQLRRRYLTAAISRAWNAASGRVARRG